MRYSIDISLPAKTKGPEARPDLLAREGYVVLVPSGLFCRGVEKQSSRLAHNQKIVGANPTAATNLLNDEWFWEWQASH